ncbi:hypothetical protein [uncultured Aliiroseovarius sp.]|uniref:hypothetical protein n=1 Tax=uncultured Aliiroseovarius sp. TaxID=1658783 RepID=UPI0025951178|nr:hypothetical protein [uncultured Aliiroseovarius sp.]
MTSTNQPPISNQSNRPHQPVRQSHREHRAMRRRSPWLPDADRPEATHTPSASVSKAVRYDDIQHTTRGDGETVTSNCHVVYSISGGPAESGLMVQRARAGMGGVIPASSALGSALIGLRVGQRAPLVFDDGKVGTVTVLEVAQTD